MTTMTTTTAHPITAIDPHRRTNAAAIVDAASLGWIGDRVLDATHNFGRFWRQWSPPDLVRCDLDPDGALTAAGLIDLRCDVRGLPFAAEAFDTSAFDPPYKLNGSGGSCAEDAGYGVADGWTDRGDLYRLGLAECARVTRRGGTVLVKCQDQIAGGRYRPQSADVLNVAAGLGLVPLGVLHVLGVTRPQPSGRPQRSPRNTSSQLLAFRRPRSITTTGGTR